MDRFGGIERDDEGEDVGGLDDGTDTVVVEIGSDERRLHVRAYNYWVSLLGGRAYPSIEDLDPSSLEEFGAQSVILDFTAGIEDPGISWLGKALREECGLGHGVTSIGDVPGRSLLSRLTDHYLQIIANRAPIGFEAEFTNHRGNETLYRGILMPFSSDDDQIDFVYGVISWKEMVSADVAKGLAAEMAAQGFAPLTAELVGEGGESNVVPLIAAARAEEEARRAATVPDLSAAPVSPELLTRLTDAQATARNAKVQEGRSRQALYQALGRAHDFAVVAEKAPEDYDRLIAEAGIAVQDRAPMTPIVKLVFGADYDKTRLTEYAAALTFARRRGIGEGGFVAFIESHPGGLKGVVAAERRLRQPGMEIDQGEEAREKLRAAEPRAVIDLETAGDEFVILLARREQDGALAVLTPVEGDRALLERAVRLGAR